MHSLSKPTKDHKKKELKPKPKEFHYYYCYSASWHYLDDGVAVDCSASLWKKRKPNQRKDDPKKKMEEEEEELTKTMTPKKHKNWLDPWLQNDMGGGCRVKNLSNEEMEQREKISTGGDADRGYSVMIVEENEIEIKALEDSKKHPNTTGALRQLYFFDPIKSIPFNPFKSFCALRAVSFLFVGFPQQQKTKEMKANAEQPKTQSQEYDFHKKKNQHKQTRKNVTKN